MSPLHDFLSVLHLALVCNGAEDVQMLLLIGLLLLLLLSLAILQQLLALNVCKVCVLFQLLLEYVLAGSVISFLLTQKLLHVRLLPVLLALAELTCIAGFLFCLMKHNNNNSQFA